MGMNSDGHTEILYTPYTLYMLIHSCIDSPCHLRTPGSTHSTHILGSNSILLFLKRVLKHFSIFLLLVQLCGTELLSYTLTKIIMYHNRLFMQIQLRNYNWFDDEIQH